MAITIKRKELESLIKEEVQLFIENQEMENQLKNNMNKILKMYELIATQTGSERVRISKLWMWMAEDGMDRKVFEQAFVKLVYDNLVDVYRFDDPQEIKPEDAKYAIKISGVPRHVVYLRQQF